MAEESKEPRDAEASAVEEAVERWKETVDRPDWTGLKPGATFRPEIFGNIAQDFMTIAETPKSKTGEVREPLEPGYALVDEIARGGMGTVWRGEQRSLGRAVAVKTVNPSVGEASVGEANRFIREARVMGALQHPNIVPVHDLVEDGDQLLLSMKLIKGEPWSELLAEDDDLVDQEEHLQILIQVCHAVAYAHSRGVIHNDLKPANVMIGEFGEILVTDWGIAVSFFPVEDTSNHAPHRSTIVQPMGTPGYVSPELAAGRGEDVGPATDVYLLGAILYEILMGRPPHAHNDSLLQTIMSAVRCAPPEFADHIPPALQEVCRKALARDPEERYPSVTDFREALQRTLDYRQSIQLTESAGEVLERIRRAANVDPPALAPGALYAGFAEALAGFRHALTLKPDNARATEGVRVSRRAFAECALYHGDLELARAQLNGLGEEDAEAETLEHRILRARAARKRVRELSRRLARVQQLEVEQRLKMITEAGVEILHASQASIWMVEGDTFTCLDMFVPEFGEHRQREHTELSEFPRYLHALSALEPLAARDALADPRLTELRDTCLEQDIHSLLHAPIHRDGELVGVLCFEQLAIQRRWTRDELDLAASLADQIALVLGAQERAEHARIQQELRTAGRFRQHLLPRAAPEVEGLDISGRLVPASELDGDFYDYVQTHEDLGRVYICVGDALGDADTGVSAGLVMSAIRAVFRTMAVQGEEPDAILAMIRRLLAPDMPEGMDVSLAILVWDSAGRTLDVAIDGLCAPLLHANRASRWITDRVVRLELQAGDLFVLYTSGLIEAVNEAGEAFGRERLASFIEGAAGEVEETRVLLESALEHVADFGVILEQQADDSVLVILRALPEVPPPPEEAEG